MTNTYVPLATITLTATDSELVFANLPSTYRDLIVVGNWAGSASANYLKIRFNGDTGNNYTGVFAFGASNGTGSFTSSTSSVDVGITRTGLGPMLLQVQDYSATNKHKTLLSRYGLSDQSELGMIAGRWANTSAVTSMTLFLSSGTISVGSTFSIYGVAA